MVERSEEGLKVSVLMAAYNAEKTIAASIDSVLSQTYGNFELIIVNDGSTDSTAEILQSYSNKDTRIKVLSQSNQGVSHTRGRAVASAQGEFSIHIDSDDFIEPNLLEKMVEKAETEKSDIVICDFIVDSANGKQQYSSQYHEGDDNRQLCRKLLNGTLHGSLCNKLIRQSIYRRYNIGFNHNLSYGEDMVVVLSMLQHPVKVDFVNHGLYHYCYNGSESLTTTVSYKAFLNRKKYCEVVSKIADNELKEDIEGMYYNLKFFGLSHGFLSRNEFYSMGPTPWKNLKKLKTSRRFIPGMVLATMRLYSLARLWCTLVE